MVDLKITELPALTTVLGEDLLAIVDDPTGTASTKKIRVDAFQNTFEGIGARVYNTADISCADNSNTILTFNSERYDTDSIHSTGTNTGRLTCNTAGKYFIWGGIKLAADADGHRHLYIQLNVGSKVAYIKLNAVTSGVGLYTISTVYNLAATDYVTLGVYIQSAGAAVLCNNESNTSPEFAMQRIG